MKQYTQNSLINIIIIAILCGCGFKGPLYLPKKVAATPPAVTNNTNESAVVKSKKMAASATKLNASSTKSNASAAKLSASATQ